MAGPLTEQVSFVLRTPGPGPIPASTAQGGQCRAEVQHSFTREPEWTESMLTETIHSP